MLLRHAQHVLAYGRQLLRQSGAFLLDAGSGRVFQAQAGQWRTGLRPQANAFTPGETTATCPAIDPRHPATREG
jgi:hypothetical protein